MHTRAVIRLVFAVLLTVHEAPANCPSANGWEEVEGQCMRCGNGRVDYLTARNFCRSIGGFLTSIHNTAQLAKAQSCQINDNLGTDEIWTGLYTGRDFPVALNLAIPGTEAWADGTPFDFSAPVILSDDDTDCFRVNLALPFVWSDQDCDIPHAFACSKQFVNCPALNPPTHAEIEYSTPVIAPEMFCVETQATYSCAAGYALALGETTRVCQESTKWSGTAPVCLSLACADDLESPANGAVSIDSGIDAVARYSCDEGFQLQGDKMRTCVDGAWTGTAPTCTAEPEDGLDIKLTIGLAVVGAVALAALILLVARWLRGRVPSPQRYLPTPTPRIFGPRGPVLVPRV